MGIKKRAFTLISIFLFFSTNFILCRSALRKSQEKKPRIEVSEIDKPKNIYYFINNNLEINPIFKTFDKQFFYQNMLPEKIVYRYDKTKYASKEELNEKLENLIKEIYKKKKLYTDFTILKQKDFNRGEKSGLLILKFKNYPFVVKMFMENPKSFVQPYSKGICPSFFFDMSGGIGRHLLGFTRIKNLHYIQEKISQESEWKDKITIPRKWYWLPKNPKNIKITGKNFLKNNNYIETIIPGTYCLIADEINLKDAKLSMSNRNSREKCMSLCNFLDVRIDPNMNNFLLEKNTDKIAIIDTEHYPTIVGLKEKQKFSGYLTWYYEMVARWLDTMYFKPKSIAK
ncbi:MAG: hypothetical protein UR12_C0025G0009 [candidate division TM6 bacterium GW2011_GWF2_30_66]|jgi:hypothetical protein|nr:MAG: hypothetical protein UR12_C0025G0009 [candidate division TM6 bacterium GW2011_GWF2_30_66]